MALPNIPNFISEINIPQNTFYFGTNKNIQPNPCQYEFYNKYAENVILPYEQNITTVGNVLDRYMLISKKDMFEQIIFYKFNNFKFNYYNSFFIKIFQDLSQLLNGANVGRNEQIKILQIVSLLNKQLDSFNTEIDSLFELLQSITTPTIEHYLLGLLLTQTRFHDQLQQFLNPFINIANPVNNYDIKLVELERKLALINNKIVTIINSINRIIGIGPTNIQDIDLDKQSKIKKYLSNFILLEGLFLVIFNSFIAPYTPIDNKIVSIVEFNIKNKFKKLYDYNNLLNKIYREKDLQIITYLDEPSKQIERDDLLKTAIFNKNQLFGHYEPAQYKRIFLPYYISVENIIELIKLRINGQLTEEQLNILIYNYNTFNYEIIIGNENNKFYYMTRNNITSNKKYFMIRIDDINTILQAPITQYSNRIVPPNFGLVQQPTYIYIPIKQEMNKIYDDAIKKYLFEYNIIPKGVYLKSYNTQKSIIINNSSINLDTKTYRFDYNDNINGIINVEIPLYDLVKNEKIKMTELPLKYFYTDYKYTPLPSQQVVQDININILTFYEDIDEEQKPNIFGIIQSKYNLYILLEQIRTKQKLEHLIYIEDYMLCWFELVNNNPQYINNIQNRIIQPLFQLFNQPNNPLLTEQHYFYMNKKSKEIIYKESNRGIVMIRLICIILYIVRIYYGTTEKSNYFQDIGIPLMRFGAYLQDPTLINNLFNSIYDFFDDNIQLGIINQEFITSIIDGSLFLKEKDLFIKKQNILEKSIEKATESIENIASEMEQFMQNTGSVSKKLMENTSSVSKKFMNYFKKDKEDYTSEPVRDKEDYTSEPVNITDFEEKNFSLTADVIKNRVKKWITGPLYDIPDWMPNIDANDINTLNNQIVYPDVIQFIGEYLNNKSEKDLVTIKNKEQICKNITSLKNTIEKNTSEIKYILPKTFFDDEYFMTKYYRKLEEPKVVEKKKL